MSKSRFPEIPGKGLCRGCGSEVKPPRQTWCSDACQRVHHPHFVRVAVTKRDNHICCICKRDIRELAKEYEAANPHPVFPVGCKWNTPEWDKWKADCKAWKRDLPKEEHDHIVPFSEGGKTVLENMRTLCSVCHKKRTKEWHKAKRK